MSARDATTGPSQPEEQPRAAGGEPDPAAAATASLPTPSTPGPQRTDRLTSSVATDVVPIAPRPDADPDPGLPSIPGYRVFGILGRGGMGIVYRALHVEMGREVALKLISPGGRDEEVMRGRFTREVRALAKIEHPNIVAVYDAGDWHGFPFYTMKLLPRGPLSRHLDQFVGDVRAGVRLVATVARAVGVLHAARVLHRDLKPLNILLGEHDEPLVADFGLARWIGDDSGPTESGSPVGTRPYMSPEQSLGGKGDYTEACDIWALGVILFEVLTGRRPFAAEDTVELYLQIRSASAPPASSINPAVPPELDAVIGRCLMKQPEDRYPTADALAADLERWLAGEFVPPAGRPDAPAPLRRRWPAAALALGLAAVVAMAGLWPRPDSTPHVAPPRTDPPPNRSVAERIAAGEPVILIGEKGPPLHPPAVAPNCTGFGILDADGFAHVPLTRAAVIDLVREPLALPLRFELEVAFTDRVWRDDFPSPCVGLHARRGQWTEPDGVHSAFIFVGCEITTDRRPDGSATMNERAVLGSQWMPADPRKRLIHRFDSTARREALPATAAAEKRWYRLALELRPGQVRGLWDGQPVGRATTTDVLAQDLRDLRRVVKLAAPAFPPEILGDGLGVCVFDAAVVVRNATLRKP